MTYTLVFPTPAKEVRRPDGSTGKNSYNNPVPCSWLHTKTTLSPTPPHYYPVSALWQWSISRFGWGFTRIL